jgi:hypothetical protein
MQKLTKPHFQMVLQQNGEEALKYFDSNLMILNQKTTSINFDLNMPVWAVEFLRFFCTSNYSDFNTTTKVVILSSTIDPEDLEKLKYPYGNFLQNQLPFPC